jgi:hypothetical protein
VVLTLAVVVLLPVKFVKPELVEVVAVVAERDDGDVVEVADWDEVESVLGELIANWLE